MSLATAHQETQRVLLVTEALAAQAIAAAARRATVNASSPAAGAIRLRHALRPAIAAQRAAARQRARVTLGNELDEAERLAHAAIPAVPEQSDAATIADELAASRAADFMAAAWLKRAERDDEDAADAATASRSGVIAGVETAQAFGAEREAALAKVAEHRDWGGVPLIGKRWDARLDACALCKRLADTVRPIGIDYPGGWTPGSRHPRCRCISAVIVIPLFWRNTPQD